MTTTTPTTTTAYVLPHTTRLVEEILAAPARGDVLIDSDGDYWLAGASTVDVIQWGLLGKMDPFTVEKISDRTLFGSPSISGYGPLRHPTTAERWERLPLAEIAYPRGTRVKISDNATLREHDGYVMPEAFGQFAVVDGPSSGNSGALNVFLIDNPTISQIIHYTHLTPAPETTAPLTEQVYATAESAEKARLEAEVTELRTALDHERAAAARFKDRVREIAGEYGREHDWCSVVDNAMADLGLDPVCLTETTFEVLVRVRFNATPVRDYYGDADSYAVEQSLSYTETGEEFTLGLDSDWTDVSIQHVDIESVDIEE